MSTEAAEVKKPSLAQQLAALGVLDLTQTKEAKAEAKKEQEAILDHTLADEKQQLIEVHVADLVESSMNPRRQWGDMDGLAKTIAAQGVIEPLVVRHVGTPVKGAKGKYEVVAGHRRLRGAKKADRATVPCVVRDLTDAQVAEIQAVENGQRKDLHALEAAESYGNMLRHGYAVPTIAAKVGKSEGHVYAHLKCLELSPESKKAFLTVDDQGYSALDLSTAIPLARLPHDLQGQALKELTGRMKGYSAREQIKFLQRDFCRHLKNAPFSLKDEALPVVPAKSGAQPCGPCVKCPRNTKNQHADLFSDFDKADRAGPGICTFTPCFDKRVDEALKAKATKAEADGIEVLSAEKAKEALGYNSGFHKLDEVEHAHPKKQTRRQILNALPDDKRPQVYLAVDERYQGDTPKPVYLVKDADFRKSVIDATDAKWAKQIDKLHNTSNDYTKKQTARLKRVKLERQVAKAAIEQIVQQMLDKGGPNRADALQLALSTLDRYHGQRVQLPALFGKANDRELISWLKEKATAADLGTFVFAAHAAQTWIPEYQAGYCDELTTLSKARHVDLKALEADFAPAKKRAAKKAAKK